MIAIEKYLADFNHSFTFSENFSPWEFISRLPVIITEMISSLNDEYIVKDQIAIHHTAVIDPTAIIHGPAIIGEHAIVGCFALVRNGAWIGKKATIGAHGEFKNSIIMNNSVCGHFNFVGESMIGSNVNLEAGAVLANHYNELKDKKCMGDEW
jgi:bifunctional N-acetylglucosamine-1-phosphate-uridyltransferase/glucosamine-1-phosphate-acetyltransferase GlmU-like protein